jgi:hypothetical protein
MLLALRSTVQHKANAFLQTLSQHFNTWTKPFPATVTVAAVTDLTRTKTDLLLEYGFLRQPLVALQRQVKRPHVTWRDRLFMILMASRLQIWRQALLIFAAIREKASSDDQKTLFLLNDVRIPSGVLTKIDLNQQIIDFV